MTRPVPPTVRAKTKAEKDADARRIQLQQMRDDARRQVDTAAMSAETASPYDLLADALMQAAGDALFAAFMSPDFAAALRARGYVLAPAPTGEPPEPPSDWMHDGIDVIGEVCQPLDALHDLWVRAWRAGYTAREATT